jgi:hypothetical protein
MANKNCIANLYTVRGTVAKEFVEKPSYPSFFNILSLSVSENANFPRVVSLSFNNDVSLCSIIKCKYCRVGIAGCRVLEHSCVEDRNAELADRPLLG